MIFCHGPTWNQEQYALCMIWDVIGQCCKTLKNTEIRAFQEY